MMSGPNDPTHTLDHRLKTYDPALTAKVSASFGSMLSAQESGTKAIIVSNQRTEAEARALANAVGQVGSELGALLSTIDSGLTDIAYVLRGQSDDLHAILAALQAPLDVQSKELRNRAFEAYASGWFEEASADFERSVELNPYDFTSYQALGNIALAHMGAPAMAFDYYSKAARYAAPKSSLDTALAYIGAAIAAGEDHAKALVQAREAVRAAPQLPEAQYALARVLVASDGWSTESRVALQSAFDGRVALTIAASADEVFKRDGAGLSEVLAAYLADLTRREAEIKGRLGARHKILSAAAATTFDRELNSLVDETAISLDGQPSESIVAAVDCLPQLVAAENRLRETAPTLLRGAALRSRQEAERMERVSREATHSVAASRTLLIVIGSYVGASIVAIALKDSLPWLAILIVVGALVASVPVANHLSRERKRQRVTVGSREIGVARELEEAAVQIAQ